MTVTREFLKRIAKLEAQAAMRREVDELKEIVWGAINPDGSEAGTVVWKVRDEHGWCYKRPKEK